MVYTWLIMFVQFVSLILWFLTSMHASANHLIKIAFIVEALGVVMRITQSTLCNLQAVVPP